MKQDNIQEIKNKIVPIAKEYGVKKISLFGSFARGEENQNSDIDILLEKSEKIRGFNFFTFINHLEKSLGRKIDVVTYKELENSFLKKYVLKDEVVLYNE